MAEGEITKAEADDTKGKGPNKDSKDPLHEAIPEDLLKDLPEDQRKIIQRITSFQGMMPLPNPIASKITPEHITKVLTNADEEDKRDRQERKDERGHNYKIMVTALIFVLLVGGLLIYSKQFEILKYFVTAVFTFAGGFGVGKYYDGNS